MTETPVARQPAWPYWVALGFFLLDQWSKTRVRLTFDLHEIVPVIPGFFNLTYVRNTGAAWGMLSGLPHVLLAVSVIMFGLIILFRHKLFTPAFDQQLGFGLLMGGIVGNMTDRVKYGYVIDFLDFHLAGRHWPAFNVADSCICVAVALFVIAGMRTPKEGKDADTSPA